MRVTRRRRARPVTLREERSFWLLIHTLLLLQLLDAVPQCGSFLVRESVGPLAGQGGALGGLLSAALPCSFPFSHADLCKSEFYFERITDYSKEDLVPQGRLPVQDAWMLYRSTGMTGCDGGRFQLEVGLLGAEVSARKAVVPSESVFIPPSPEEAEEKSAGGEEIAEAPQ
jgi:hypothetical protein